MDTNAQLTEYLYKGEVIGKIYEFGNHRGAFAKRFSKMACKYIVEKRKEGNTTLIDKVNDYLNGCINDKEFFRQQRSNKEVTEASCLMLNVWILLKGKNEMVSFLDDDEHNGIKIRGVTEEEDKELEVCNKYGIEEAYGKTALWGK